MIFEAGLHRQLGNHIPHLGVSLNEFLSAMRDLAQGSERIWEALMPGNYPEVWTPYPGSQSCGLLYVGRLEVKVDHMEVSKTDRVG